MSDVVTFINGISSTAKTATNDLEHLAAVAPEVVKANDAVEGLTKTIQKLIATAGAGGAPSTDQSPTGALNKAFGS